VLAGPFPGRGRGPRLTAVRAIDVPGAVGDRFWGLAALDLDLRALGRAARLDRLDGLGYDYRLTAVRPPGRSLVLARSTELEPVDPVQAAFPLLGESWTLALVPRAGWRSERLLATQAVLVLVIALLIALWTHQVLREPEALRREVATRARRLSDA